jgi:hypothetical protein
MKLVTIVLREEDIPLIAHALRNHTEHLISHIVNAAQLALMKTPESTATITKPVKLSKNGKRMGRPPKGSK